MMVTRVMTVLKKIRYDAGRECCTDQIHKCSISILQSLDKRGMKSMLPQPYHFERQRQTRWTCFPFYLTKVEIPPDKLLEEAYSFAMQPFPSE
jgi:hypothetical protein